MTTALAVAGFLAIAILLWHTLPSGSGGSSDSGGGGSGNDGGGGGGGSRDGS